MSFDPQTFAAILAMTAATMFTRFSGAWIVRRLTLGDKTQKALGVVPPAVLMAVVAPVALSEGLAETLACAVTAIAALRLSLLPAAALGVLTIAVLRAAGL
ncbi:AzlD family protein [Rhizobium halophytocola]|uniref:Membrane protein n=1 Tax=Rhizobium halophytocola TaxID=735519 RepID=A0ABS4DYK9_9HYPH|nr:AzlD domain-containing protein [Rhizobium halophytocola]MBP1850770.1 putative membrane protein [Rhizobium halophytocola]